MDDKTPVRVFGEPPAGIECRDRSAAYAVIRNQNGRVAVIRAHVCRRDQFWLPGGGMRESESPPETVIREVREELGNDVRVHREVGRRYSSSMRETRAAGTG